VARYPELVRLADPLGADDPEDIGQKAFARLIQRQRALRDQDAALAALPPRHREAIVLRYWLDPIPVGSYPGAIAIMP
jgi:DNA-directed RNA polymerase specialized sigma24 family protein